MPCCAWADPPVLDRVDLPVSSRVAPSSVWISMGIPRASGWGSRGPPATRPDGGVARPRAACRAARVDLPDAIGDIHALKRVHLRLVTVLDDRIREIASCPQSACRRGRDAGGGRRRGLAGFSLVFLMGLSARDWFIRECREWLSRTALQDGCRASAPGFRAGVSGLDDETNFPVLREPWHPRARRCPPTDRA